MATIDPWPSLVHVPTGAGKTAAVLGAWLWRRKNRPETVGRRLVYCLPMRTLVEQTDRVAQAAINKLIEAGLIAQDRFKVHVLMGGDVSDVWDMRPEQECILIGTQDMLLSRALNRGYAMSRFRWPVHFGLLNNDCLWVFDEIQLMGDGLATSTQLAAFREKLQTVGPCHSIWMSATLDREWLKTIDFASRVAALATLELGTEDRAAPALAQRLNAVKRISPAPPECRLPAGLAQFVNQQHYPGSQTLIVVNSVARAREVFAELQKVYGLTGSKKQPRGGDPKFEGKAPTLKLLHSRFRPNERKGWAQMLDEKPDGPGRIIVATQVVEAGLDISSRLLVTDLAPYASLVQRFGRVNRAGELEEARIYWVDRPLTEKTGKLADKDTLDDKELEKIALPYEWRDLQSAQAQLVRLESAAPVDLERIKHHDPYVPAHVLRLRDLIDLFDTTPDLSGYDLDISRFVRGGDERDVLVAWRDIGKKAPAKMTPRLTRDELCPVSIGDIKEFLKNKNRSGDDRTAWRWDALDGEWRKVTADELRPGLTLLVDMRDGGYDEQRGWDGASKEVVNVVVPATNAPNDGYADDRLTYIKYRQTLAAHSREAKAAAERLISLLNDLALDEWREALIFATHHHDLGKAHKIFQATLHGKSSEDWPFEPVLAKSDLGGRHARPHFRHELASALALLQMERSDLEIYLAACHHGKVRLSIRSLPGEQKPEQEGARYARGIWDGEVLPATDLGDGVRTEAIPLNLEPMLLGASENGARSWLERMITLRDRIGVFRLAYLECLIRAADVRASMNPQDVLD
ncbi:MAG TPA: CRISPR-associated helicase Cas3' [Blastocatellia bacterium]|nr:CRISPR-associated helicase Cas3' [Blastocatellia bacterium]